MIEHEGHLDVLARLAEMEYLRRKRNYLEVHGLTEKIKRDLDSIYGTPSAYHESRRKALPSSQIKKVIFNDPATIVFWEDGAKTVVKAQDEPFDKEKGLSMAIVKRLYGNTGKYFDEIKRWVSDEEADRSVPPTAMPLSKIIVDGANAFKDALKSKGLCINKLGANNDTAEKASDRSDQKAEER